MRETGSLEGSLGAGIVLVLEPGRQVPSRPGQLGSPVAGPSATGADPFPRGASAHRHVFSSHLTELVAIVQLGLSLTSAFVVALSEGAVSFCFRC